MTPTSPPELKRQTKIPHPPSQNRTKEKPKSEFTQKVISRDHRFQHVRALGIIVRSSCAVREKLPCPTVGRRSNHTTRLFVQPVRGRYAPITPEKMPTVYIYIKCSMCMVSHVHCASKIAPALSATPTMPPDVLFRSCALRTQLILPVWAEFEPECFVCRDHQPAASRFGS
jgi:hypothetical protein